MKDEDLLIVTTTFANRDDAIKAAEVLVEERWAACAQISENNLTSIYHWNSKIEEATETQVVFKTLARNFNGLCRRLKEIHPYETPEILALPVVDGFKPYLDWVKKESR